MIYDLHSHTTFSDGELTPQELISLAVEKDVDVLAITDHDTLDAYRELPSSHDKIRIVPGIELSTQWDNTGIHIIGLNFDPGSDAIQSAAKIQTDATVKPSTAIATVALHRPRRRLFMTHLHIDQRAADIVGEVLGVDLQLRRTGRQTGRDIQVADTGLGLRIPVQRGAGGIG